MTTFNTHYELGARYQFKTISNEIFWKNTKSIEGILAFARNNITGEYVRVYEVSPTEWVQGEPQSWDRGNFETVENAIKFASKAYQYLNKGRGA